MALWYKLHKYIIYMFIVILNHAKESSGVMSLRVYVLSLLYIFGFRNSAKGKLFFRFMAVKHTATAKLINWIIISRIDTDSIKRSCSVMWGRGTWTYLHVKWNFSSVVVVITDWTWQSVGVLTIHLIYWCIPTSRLFFSELDFIPYFKSFPSRKVTSGVKIINQPCIS